MAVSEAVAHIDQDAEVIDTEELLEGHPVQVNYHVGREDLGRQGQGQGFQNNHLLAATPWEELGLDSRYAAGPTPPPMITIHNLKRNPPQEMNFFQAFASNLLIPWSPALPALQDERDVDRTERLP